MKKSKNSIKIIARGKMLSLVIPKVYCGAQKTIAIGISNNQENWKFAELKAKQMEVDFVSGHFDITLKKYRDIFQPPTPVITIPGIYLEYINFRKNQVSISTWKCTYQITLNHLIACPYKLLGESLKLRDWAVQNRTIDTANRILMQINAACEWALERGKIFSNPFKGKAKIKSKKSKPKIHPFSLEEKNRIIEGFKESEKFADLLPIIKFFFLTGCRTGEALALQWKHIKADRSIVRFEEVIVLGEGGASRKVGTKQSSGRNFPCNEQLKNLLLSIRPDKRQATQAVFARADGSPVSHQDLRTAWYGKGKSPGIVKQLAIDAQVEAYRPQYNTRHTMISQCLEAGVPPTQIAEWVGNSAEIIFRNYAGIINKVSVPEFD